MAPIDILEGFILRLGESNCRDRTIVGGKAAHLSELAAHFRVPPGFCLTTLAYDLVAASGFDGPGSYKKSSDLPAALMEPVATAYRELAERCGEPELSVAVRSSAVDEDGASASFAGQYETLLNVVGLVALGKAIARCWESANSERATEYRRQRGLTADGGRLAVLVQQLVLADVSAVVFGANPVSGSREEIVINANWGLGESIVGGVVTPDTFIIRKTDLAIVTRHIGDKQRMTVAEPGGTREVEVPRMLRAQPALEDRQISELARLAVELENRMGWPVDIECAYRGGELYLLQCRAVTTL